MAKAKNPHADQPNAPPGIEIDDVDEKPAATKDQLNAVYLAAQEQQKLKQKKARLDSELEAVEALLNESKTVTLIGAMDTAHIDMYPLSAGYYVEAWTDIKASVPSPDNPKVEDAVERNAKGVAYIDEVAPDLLIHQITITYPKGSEKFVNKLLGNLKKYKPPIPYSQRTTVNQATLSKWARLKIEAGEKVDDEAISLKRKRMAEVFPPKKKGKTKHGL